MFGRRFESCRPDHELALGVCNVRQSLQLGFDAYSDAYGGLEELKIEGIVKARMNVLAFLRA
ncbi:hypothetical protein GJ688_02705 [Heliobacillus mobilis]|uniref:Uncharacterized protein n=1 Tax=Heliobacterium mobile TaxID=28064 RepID=A0A6I3SCH7_HELMO|nr:hypothetical protein [Heliobacterium mobile]